VENKFKEKTIDSFSCRSNKFTGSASFKIFVELVQLFGPGLASLLGSTARDGSIKSVLDTDSAGLQLAMSSLMGKLNPDTNLAFIKKLLSSTTIDGQDLNDNSFDLIFQGKLLSMFKVLLFVIEVNYEDFLGEGGFRQVLAQVNPPQDTKNILNS